MISFRTLGTIELVGPDGQELLSVLSQPKRLALLTYLTVAAPQGHHRRDKLLGLLWPELDRTRGRAALRKSLHHLRKSIGAEALSTRGDEEVGVTEGAIECDVAAIDQALKDGRLDDAVDRYSGPFMDGFFISEVPEFERWIELQRDAVARRVREAAWSLVGASEKEGNSAGALSWAERAHLLDPFDDRGARLLFELKVRLGDRAGALRCFERFADRLRNELDLEPSEELMVLVERMSEPAHSGVTANTPAGAVAGLQLNVGGDLESIRLLADGSVARVFLAREAGLHRLVAVKVLHPRLAQVQVARQRFERAARAAAQVGHPNVVAIHRVGVLEDGTPYLVMEFIDGRSLKDAIKADGLPTPVGVRRILRQVASALAASHENGVVHRDLRPANILLEDRTERIVLTDFGVARILSTGSEQIAQLTQPGQLLGDASHVSPEQIRGEPATQASDVYSLGVLGYSVIVGRGPFEAAGALELLEAHTSWEPDDLRELRAGMDEDLAGLLERCLAKKPSHRPRAADVARLLA